MSRDALFEGWAGDPDGAPDSDPDSDPDGGPAAALPGGARAAAEALLMVTDAPLPVALVAEALGLPEPEAEALVRDLSASYDAELRGFELRESAGGWRVYSRREFAPLVTAFLGDALPARLSRAALETLAVVAYRQPVSRQGVAAVRGVSTDGVLRTLAARGLVAEVGTDPGTGAVLFGVTPALYERLGVSGPSDLPPLAPYLPELSDVADELGALDGRGIDELDAAAP